MTELCRPSPADPSRGEAEGVVKDAGADKEIAGKLELLKGGSGWACCEAGSGVAGHVVRLAAACSEQHHAFSPLATWHQAAPRLVLPSGLPSAGISFFACPGELTALMGGSGELA